MKKILSALVCILSSAFAMDDYTRDQIGEVQKYRYEDVSRSLKICEYFVSNPYIAYAEKVHMVIVMHNLHWQMSDFFGMELDYQLLKQMATVDPEAKRVLQEEYEAVF